VPLPCEQTALSSVARLKLDLNDAVMHQPFPELSILLDEYLALKDESKTLPNKSADRRRLKGRYQALERKIISQLPAEYRYRGRVLMKGRNDY
jgi:hypothetical protein